MNALTVLFLIFIVEYSTQSMTAEDPVVAEPLAGASIWAAQPVLAVPSVLPACLSMHTVKNLNVLIVSILPSFLGFGSCT